MNSEKFAKLIVRCLIGYSVVAVVAFGPATVQSENARAEHLAECESKYKPSPIELYICRSGAPTIADGAFKAIFWPFWLSYTIASSI